MTSRSYRRKSIQAEPIAHERAQLEARYGQVWDIILGNAEKLNSDVKYDPELNDGVVLNIVPPWKLVPRLVLDGQTAAKKGLMT